MIKKGILTVGMNQRFLLGQVKSERATSHSCRDRVNEGNGSGAKWRALK